MAATGPMIKEDDGRINARILAKIDKVDYLARVEASRRKIPVRFRSPEIKRIFLRYFDSMQLNMHFVSVIARTRLSAAAVEDVEASVEQRLKQATQAIDAAIDQTAVLLEANGITSQADYDALPLELTVRVISGFGRRFLELMNKVDQLMPLLDTLAIDGVITQKNHVVQKSTFTKSVRSIAGGVRIFANGLRRRMQILAEQEAGKEANRGAGQTAAMIPSASEDGTSGDGHDAVRTELASPHSDAASVNGQEKSAAVVSPAPASNTKMGGPLPAPDAMPAEA